MKIDIDITLLDGTPICVAYKKSGKFVYFLEYSSGEYKKLLGSTQIKTNCTCCGSLHKTTIVASYRHCCKYAKYGYFFVCKSCTNSKVYPDELRRERNIKRTAKETVTKIKNGTTGKDLVKAGTHPLQRMDQSKGSPIRAKMAETRKENDSNTNKGTEAYEKRKMMYEAKSAEELAVISKKESETRKRNGTTMKDIAQSGKRQGFVNLPEEEKRLLVEKIRAKQLTVQENGLTLMKNIARQRTRRAIEQGKIIDWSDITVVAAVDNYYYLCWQYTNENNLRTLDNYEKRGRAMKNKDHYHLDHIIPIKYGFLNNIDPKIIGSINNLRFIPWMENVLKSDTLTEEASILLDQLQKGDIK